MEGESTDLRALYAETRLMEKKVSVARVELQQEYEQAKQQLVEMAERKVQAIRKLEKQASAQLQHAQSVLSSNSVWENFQKYAKQVRKVHLGGSKPVSLSSCKKQAVITYLQSLQAARTKCQAILAHYSLQFTVETQEAPPQLSRELSFHAVTAHSERILHKLRTEPSFEISPIKRKQDLPQKDTYNNFTHSKAANLISPLQHKIDSTSLLLSEQPASTRIALKRPQIHLPSPSIPAQPLPQHTLTTPPSLRVPQPAIHPLASTSRHSNNHNQLSKVRSEGKLLPPSSTSKGVLQLLQLQQVRFDKLKHGLL